MTLLKHKIKTWSQKLLSRGYALTWITQIYRNAMQTACIKVRFNCILIKITVFSLKLTCEFNWPQFFCLCLCTNHGQSIMHMRQLYGQEDDIFDLHTFHLNLGTQKGNFLKDRQYDRLFVSDKKMYFLKILHTERFESTIRQVYLFRPLWFAPHDINTLRVRMRKKAR